MLLKTIKCLILIVFLLNSPQTYSMDEKSTATINTLDRILIFSYNFLLKKDSTFKHSTKAYRTWLKSCPKEDAQQLCQCYEEQFFKIFANPRYFNLLVKAIFKDENLKGFNALAEKDKMWLITLFIKHYSHIHDIKNLDPYDIINFSFYEYFKLTPAMQLFKRNPYDFIFLWDEGAGSHNNSYIILALQLKNNIFTTQLLEIPYFNEKSNNIEKQHSINASGSSYDPHNDLLIMNISSGDVSGWIGVQAIYKIDEHSLTLIKQRSTKKYQTMCPNEHNYFNVGINAGNLQDWQDEYVAK